MIKVKIYQRGNTMKRTFIAVTLGLMLIFTASPVWSLTLPWIYDSPIDSIVAYGSGSPNEASEQGYLALYLGVNVSQLNTMYTYFKDNDIGLNDYKDLNFGYDPGFSWDYAIVKVDGPNDFWYLFIDDNGYNLNLSMGDDILTTPPYGTPDYNMGVTPKGISHVSWFTLNQVPEPMTLLLLGLGIVGLAGVRKFKG